MRPTSVATVEAPGYNYLTPNPDPPRPSGSNTPRYWYESCRLIWVNAGWSCEALWLVDHHLCPDICARGDRPTVAQKETQRALMFPHRDNCVSGVNCPSASTQKTMPAGVAIVDKDGQEFMSSGAVVLCCHSGNMFVRCAFVDDK